MIHIPIATSALPSIDRYMSGLWPVAKDWDRGGRAVSVGDAVREGEEAADLLPRETDEEDDMRPRLA
jgi:hypothetical protein